MEYDRVYVKQAARDAVHRGDPRPWLVTLVFYLVGMIPGNILNNIMTLPQTMADLSRVLDYGYRYGYRYDYWDSGLPFLVLLFVNILLALLSAVFQAGYTHYSMNLWRGWHTEVRDIFHCFHMAGRVICLHLLILAFSILWGLLATLVMAIPLTAVLWFIPSRLAYLSILLIAVLGAAAFLINRTLRYSLALYVMLDHPDWGALDCLKESKALMAGRRWSLFVLRLSFLGWYLLIFAIMYAVFVVGVLIGAYMILNSNIDIFIFIIFFTFLIMGALLVGVLCASPLILWLTPYVSTATAGFYDCAAGYEFVEEASDGGPGPDQRLEEDPAPHFYQYGGPAAGETPPPPGPSGPEEAEPRAGGFYSGFGQKEPDNDPNPPDSDSEP